MSLRKKLFDHKENSCHRTAVKRMEEDQKETLENVCMKSLSRGEEVTAKHFIRHMIKSQPFNNFED
jgi:hypothetical protein